MNFTKKIVNHRYELMIPEDFLKWLDVTKAGALLDGYEPEHIKSMEELLEFGDKLFVIGAETGWLAAIMAQFVGGNHIGLFEPSDVQWPAIHATWDANKLATPALAFSGFLGDRDLAVPGGYEKNALCIDTWPSVVAMGEWRMEYRSLKERGGFDIPVKTVDQVVSQSGIVPKALTIDVEGSELKVLRGAEQTLRHHHPLVWLSIHQVPRDYGDTGPLVYDYGSSREEVLTYAMNQGYTPRFLEDSMDQQWLLE